MSRPKIKIPLDDVIGLKKMIESGKTQSEMAEYYGVDQSTISRRIAELKDS